MGSVLLNPITKKSVDAFINLPSHGLMVAGPSGSGKTYLSEFIASKLLGLSNEKLHSYAYFIVLKPEPSKNQISIEQIREVKRSANLKTLGQAKLKRVVLIEQAELMSHEAQNALLKLLEEPSEDTVFILTTNDFSNLLPTISSRLQSIVIHPVSLEMTQNFFKGTSNDDIERAWRLSLGYSGLTHSLLTNKVEHELNSALSDAREILILPVYERLLLVSVYSVDKFRTNLMLVALSRLLSASHFNAISKKDNNQIAKILIARQTLAKVQSDISHNGNLKLNLLYLFTSIG